MLIYWRVKHSKPPYKNKSWLNGGFKHCSFVSSTTSAKVGRSLCLCAQWRAFSSLRIEPKQRLVILDQQDGSTCSNHFNEMFEAEHQNYLYDIIRYRVWKCMDILHCENANVHLTIHGQDIFYIELYTSCTHHTIYTCLYTNWWNDGRIDRSIQ